MIEDTPAEFAPEQPVPKALPGQTASESGAVEADPAADCGVDERRERLKATFLAARDCTRCPQLVGARTQVVFGGGDADAALMLVGEAPGAREDEQGQPFVGAAGRLLDELLVSIGLTRADVFVTNVLKCRPPGNRDPAPAEIERCRPYLDQQIALVRPRVIVTLGNYATRLLRDDSAPITELHGRPEVRVLGGRAVLLLPLFHPAAALYTRALLDTLRDDFATIPELLARPELAQPEPVQAEDGPAESGPEELESDGGSSYETQPTESIATSQQPPKPDPDAAGERAPGEAGDSGQLGLF